MRSSSLIYIAGCISAPSACAAAAATMPALHGLADIAALARLPQDNETDSFNSSFEPASKIWLSRISDLAQARMRIMRDFKARNHCKLTVKLLEPLNKEFTTRGLPRMSPLALKHYESRLASPTRRARFYSDEEATVRDAVIHRVIRANPGVVRTALADLVAAEIRKQGLPTNSPMYLAKLISRANRGGLPVESQLPVPHDNLHRSQQYTQKQVAVRQDLILRTIAANPGLTGAAVGKLVADEISTLRLPAMKWRYIVQLVNRLRGPVPRGRPRSALWAIATTTVVPCGGGADGPVDLSPVRGEVDMAEGDKGSVLMYNTNASRSHPDSDEESSDDVEIIVD